MNGLVSTNEAESLDPPACGALGDVERLTSTFIATLLPVLGLWAWSSVTPRGRSKIHFFSSMSEKKSDKSRSSADKVDFDPMMMSFFLARVNATLILRQSRRSSPICRHVCQNRCMYRSCATHAAEVIRPDHRNDDAILVSSLTLVRGHDFDCLGVLQHGGQDLDLLTIRRDHTDLLLADAARYQFRSKLWDR
jgi:hypothetical protein